MHHSNTKTFVSTKLLLKDVSPKKLIRVTYFISRDEKSKCLWEGNHLNIENKKDVIRERKKKKKVSEEGRGLMDSGGLLSC